MPLRWEQVADVEPADFTLATVPAIYARDGDAHAGIDASVGSLDALLELSAEHERTGLGADAPWPPNYRKQEAEPPRVQPSRQKRADADYNTPEAEVAREKSRIAMEKRFERMAAERGPGYGRAASPTGRRVSTKPLVEIARAAKKDEATAGLERWKARHADIVDYLQPADVLTDSMRGRNTTWTRIRVNLEHVPEDQRPAQERLEVDYDPWVEWAGPDRSGELARPTRRTRTAGP